MSDQLKEALAMSQTAIEAGLNDARAELETLHARQIELEALIARGEAALGTGTAESEDEGRFTLHVALERILRENDNRWMTVQELSDEVNRRGLYQKKDGSAIEPNQVHARTKNYRKLFEKHGPQVRLALAVDDWDVVIFRDDDKGFFAWLDEQPSGFFINTERKLNPHYLVLHMSNCHHFDRDPSLEWTKGYVKVCSERRDQLEGWAKQAVGGDVTLCGSCFG
jgi:hypothetical protein